MTIRRSIRTAAAVLAFLAIGAPSVSRALDPAAKCAAAKQRAAARFAAANISCAVRRTLGRYSDVGLHACQAKAAQKAAAAFFRAEVPIGCLTMGDQGTILGLLATCTDSAVAQLPASTTTFTTSTTSSTTSTTLGLVTCCAPADPIHMCADIDTSLAAARCAPLGSLHPGQYCDGTTGLCGATSVHVSTDWCCQIGSGCLEGPSALGLCSLAGTLSQGVCGPTSGT